MAKRKRRTHSALLKSKVSLAAMAGDKMEEEEQDCCCWSCSVRTANVFSQCSSSRLVDPKISNIQATSFNYFSKKGVVFDVREQFDDYTSTPILTMGNIVKL